MKPPLRIIDTGLQPARWNVAMTAALAELHAKDGSRIYSLKSPLSHPQPYPPPPCGEGSGVGGLPTSGVLQSPPPSPSPTFLGRPSGATGEGTLRRARHLNPKRQLPSSDTMRLHRYPPCVLLGASQDLASAADVAYCRGAGIEIARRITGGGAVYMSPGMLAWDALVDRRECGGDLAAVTERVCSGIAAGLSRLGLAARFRGPNDIVIDGRKVSGSSGYAAGRTAVLQGTVLIGDDVPVMARALRLPEAELRARVTCLEAERGAAPSLPAVVDGITMGLAEALGREPVPDRARSDELALCTDLLRATGTDAYVARRADAPA